jgi:NAD(P)-dependent dehydrogenase (short-subunit alcohol dehydrogenase family)
MTAAPIVVVTGANRGIGFEICRQLAARGAEVVLTARNKDAGKIAASKLSARKLTVQFHLLDVSSRKSIAALREFLETTYGRLDVLINNAGVVAKNDSRALDVDMETVRVTLETNALGPFHLAQALVPLLQASKQARIVNLSSGMGAFSEMEGDYAAYRLSKTALNAISVMLAAELRGRIAVNAACPGWVKTDMGGRNAERDVSEGADTPVWLALDAPQMLTGRFVRDRKVIPW